MIVLLLGLLAGYALNYAVFQPQLQELRSNLNEINLKLDDYSDYNSTIDSLLSEVSRLNDLIDELNSTIIDTNGNETEEPQPFERLQIQSLTAIKSDSEFEIYFNITNTGTVTTALYTIYFNQTMVYDVFELTSFVINGTDLPTNEPFMPEIIHPGNTMSGTLKIAESATYTSGTLIAMSFQTTTQRGYSGSIILP